MISEDNEIFKRYADRTVSTSPTTRHNRSGYVVLSVEYLGRGRFGVDLGWQTDDISFQSSKEKSIVLKYTKDIDGRDHRFTQRRPGDPSWGFMTSDSEDYAGDDIWFYIEPEHWDKFYKQYDNLFNITDHIKTFNVAISKDRNLRSIILK
jgi:hypothetical protein